MSVNEKMTAIANEVRTLSGATDKLSLDEMASHTKDANTEVATQEELIQQIKTALQGKSAVGDAEPVIHPLEVTENGTYTAPDGVDGYSPVSVNVPVPDGYIVPSGTKNITENGTHDAKAYESVNVNVPIPDGYIQPSGELEVTENGTHDVTAYASVNVNVPTGGGEDVAGAIADRTVTEFINNNATSIGAYVFRYCAALKTVDAPNAKSVGNYAFDECSALNSVNLPLVETVGQYAFQRCNKLKKIILPSATTLSSNAFREVQYAEKIDLVQVTNIPTYCFYGCRGLIALILRSETMVTLANTNAFTSCYRINGTKNAGFNPNGEKLGFIYVPKALLSDEDETMDYRRATNWSSENLVTQFRAIEDYPEICGG